MGVTFHYKGRLRKASDLQQFLEEVEDIANILEWSYDVFEATYPDHQYVSPVNDKIYGIIIFPEACEPVCLTFDSEGRLFNPIVKEMFDKNEAGDFRVITIQIDLNEDEIKPVIKEGDDDTNQMEIMYSLSVATQAGSIDTHARLVELLKYLSAKYFEDFRIVDESGYADIRNIEGISHKLDDINRMIEMFQDAVEENDIKSPEDFIRLIKSFGRQLKKNKE